MNSLGFNLRCGHPEGAQPSSEHFPPNFYYAKLRFGTNVWEEIMGRDDAKLAKVAKDAYFRMYQQWDQAPISGKLPMVMTAFAVGNELYLASSLVHSKSFLYNVEKQHPLRICLEECEDAFIRNGASDQTSRHENRPHHKNNACCGEMMALAMWFSEHTAEELQALHKGHMVSVRPEKTEHDSCVWVKMKGNGMVRTITYEKILRCNPCGKDQSHSPRPDSFGCFQCLERFGFKNQGNQNKKSFDQDFRLPKAKIRRLEIRLPIENEGELRRLWRRALWFIDDAVLSWIF